MLLKSKLSHIYHPLIPNLGALEIPNEKLADCQNCQSCTTNSSPFSYTKCCTYHPVIPNYMIGAILSQDNPLWDEGKNRVLNKIENKIGVTPFGVVPPHKHSIRYNNYIKKPNQINQNIAKEIRCPFYDEGRCSIWSYRTGLCSTYFCMSSGGEYGKYFWFEFNKYFKSLENKLALFVLSKKGYPSIKIRLDKYDPKKIKLENSEGKLDHNKYSSLWDRWEGEEVLFYKDCYEVFKSITPEKVKEILGIEEKVMERKIIERLEMFKENIVPDYLEYDTSTVWNKIEEFNGISFSIKNNQSIKLTPVQVKFLKLFDGKTSTYEIVRKAVLINSDISRILPSLLKNDVLKRC